MAVAGRSGFLWAASNSNANSDAPSEKRGGFVEETFARRDRHRPRLQPEVASDAVDGLPEGDRWSTWDQTENPIPNEPPAVPLKCHE